MKILHRKVNASSDIVEIPADIVEIPAPLDKYYDIATDAEMYEITGMNAEELMDTSAEDTPGYNVKHVAWVIAKPEYEEVLANSGLDGPELLDEDGRLFVGYQVRDRIYSVTEDDVLEALRNVDEE